MLTVSQSHVHFHFHFYERLSHELSLSVQNPPVLPKYFPPQNVFFR